MTSINKLTSNASANSNDLIPIWDSENQRTRNLSVKVLSEFINKGSSTPTPLPTEDKYLISGVLNNGTLTLNYNTGGSFSVTGFNVGGVVDETNEGFIPVKKSDKFVNSSITDRGDGVDVSGTLTADELKTRISSLTLGDQKKISGIGEGVVIKDLSLNRHKFITNQLLSKATDLGPFKYKQGTYAMVPIQTDTSTQIVNPEFNFTTSLGDQILYAFDVRVPSTQLNVIAEIQRQGNPKPIWREEFPSVPNGTLDIDPVVLDGNTTYRFKITGTFLGNAQGVMYYGIGARLATKQELITDADVGFKPIELPTEYNNFNNQKWLTVLDDFANGADSAYFINKASGNTFTNIDLTFHPLSEYLGISFIIRDPKSGYWAQRISFSTDSDWPDNARTFQRAGSTPAIAMVSGFRKFAFTGDLASFTPSVGVHFAGIYNTLQDLKDAIASPTNNLQAIVLTPSEKYYHGVGNQWVELAPVGALHPTYVGSYDTVQDLQAAEPSPSEDDLAIVGTTAKAFYIYDGSAWKLLDTADLNTLQTKVTALENGFQILDTRSRANQAALAFKISGIKVKGTNQEYDDVKSIEIEDSTLTKEQDGNVKVKVAPLFAVTDGTNTTLARALNFDGATVSADPNTQNTAKIEIGSAPSFDTSIFNSAVDHGYAPDDASIKSTKTSEGWWIFKDLDSISGRPTDSKGDLIVFKKALNDVDPNKRHAFVMAIGKDEDDADKVWFMYRNGTVWTPWFDVDASQLSEIQAIKQDLGKLKAADASVTQKVGQLQTSVGQVYSPNKLTFDKNVNALIQAALQNYKPKKPGHGGTQPAKVYPRIYAVFSNSVPTSLTSAVTSTNAEATLLRIPTTLSRVFVLVENDNDEASKVKGISVNDSLKASWQYRDTTIGGTKYRAFFSAGGYREKKLDIKVDFGQGI